MSKKEKSRQPIRQNPFLAAKRPQRIMRGNVEQLDAQVSRSVINGNFTFGRGKHDTSNDAKNEKIATQYVEEVVQGQPVAYPQDKNLAPVIADNANGNGENIESAELSPIQQKVKKDNRRLVIMNIVFLLFALISIVSLLFMPFAKIDIKLNSKTIASTVDSVKDESFNQAFNGYLKKEDIKNATKDINIKFGIVNFTTFDFLKVGIDKDLSKTKEIAKKYISENLVKPVEELVNQTAPAVFALSARMAISLVAGTVNITAEQFDSMLTAANSVITNLEKNNLDAATTSLMTAIDPILTANNLSSKKDTIQTKVKEVLTIIQTNGTENSKFELNNVIGNLSTIIEEITAIGQSTSRATDNAKTDNNFIGDFISNIANPDKLVEDAVNQLSEQERQWIAYGIFGFGLLTCISAAIWAFLALRILIRFFTKKKAVSLWSVIWFGGIQAVWMLPLILLAVFNLANIVSYVSWTWISLAVSLLTMIFYFIFYRGAKKRIKKLRKGGLI